MFDFDKDFENYLVNWYKKHEDEFENVEDMEDKLPDIYNEWADSPSEQLKDIAPRAFFDNIKSPDELLSLLVTTSTGELNPCSLLMDRVVEVKECAEGLRKIIDGSYSTKQKMLCINLLNEMGQTHPFDVYAQWLFDDEIESDLKELAVEVLQENADTVRDFLLEKIADAKVEAQILCADILVNAQKDERIFNLLVSLFENGDKSLFAGNLGKYGDERAVEHLYKALANCNYIEFIEIKNAIERLGGIVDEESFDFSDDAYYKTIKNS